MILTVDEIEAQARKCGGTYIKRNNLRKRLKASSNATCQKEIDSIKKEIRARKVAGAKEGDLREMYAKITHLEMRIL